MATVVSGNGRSCGALIAVILGLMCVTLQGAALRIVHDVVALGHDSMESPLLLLDPPMRSKTNLESVLFWSNSYPRSKRANDRWCVQPWVLMKSEIFAPKQVTLKELTAKHAKVVKRQEDMAKRIIETQRNLESFTKKVGGVVNGEMQDHD